jgi:hypothetical protein
MPYGSSSTLHSAYILCTNHDSPCAYCADSPATAGVWNRLTKPPEAKIAMSLSRAEYLDSVVPGEAASSIAYKHVAGVARISCCSVPRRSDQHPTAIVAKRLCLQVLSCSPIWVYTSTVCRETSRVRRRRGRREQQWMAERQWSTADGPGRPQCRTPAGRGPSPGHITVQSLFKSLPLAAKAYLLPAERCRQDTQWQPGTPQSARRQGCRRVQCQRYGMRWQCCWASRVSSTCGRSGEDFMQWLPHCHPGCRALAIRCIHFGKTGAAGPYQACSSRVSCTPQPWCQSIPFFCFRQFLRRSNSAGAQQAAAAGDRHLGDWLKGQPDVLVIRSKFIAKHAGDGRDDALRGIVLEMLKVSTH